MAPKGKGRKTGAKDKVPAVNDNLSVEEMNKEQLEKHIVRLREELERERKEKSSFQLERDRIQSLWEISQKDLVRVQRDLNRRHIEKEEAEERHRMETNVYKLKLRHLLSEQHAAVSELKTDQTQAQNLQRNEDTQQELHRVNKKSTLQQGLQEKQHKSDQSLRTLQLKQQMELMELMNDYDQKVRGIEERFRAHSLGLTQQHEQELQQEVSEVEAVMKRRLSELKAEQQSLRTATEEQYISEYGKLRADYQELNKQLSALKEKHAAIQRKLPKAQAESAQMMEELEENQVLLSDLRPRVMENQRNKQLEKRFRERQKQLDLELRSLKRKNLLLEQAICKLEQERDGLRAGHLELALDVQQKNGLKEALLHKKMSVLKLQLQRTEELVQQQGLEPPLTSS